jgi:hypothetical protein
MEQAQDIRELLLRLADAQNDAAAMLVSMQADIETLRLALVVISPGFAENLGKAFAANRERYLQELERRKAEHQLIRAKFSTTEIQ